MDLKEAIGLRTSRRAYLEMPVSSSKLDLLRDLINKYNTISGLSIQLIENASVAFKGMKKSYGIFKGVRTIIAMKSNVSVECYKEKLGYYGEYIVLEATALGLGTSWVGGTFDKKSKIFNIGKDEELVCVITVGNTTDNPSFKENMIRRMSRGKTKSLDHYYTSDVTPPDWFLEGIKAVQSAPSALNRQRYKFEYNNGIISAVSEDSSTYDLIDFGIAKAHFIIACGGSFEFGNPSIYSR